MHVFVLSCFHAFSSFSASFNPPYILMVKDMCMASSKCQVAIQVKSMTHLLPLSTHDTGDCLVLSVRRRGSKASCYHIFRSKLHLFPYLILIALSLISQLRHSYIVLCHSLDTLCHPMTSRVTPCHPMTSRVTPCHPMTSRVTPCHSMTSRVTSRDIPSHPVSLYDIPCHFMSPRVTPCHSMSLPREPGW